MVSGLKVRRSLTFCPMDICIGTRYFWETLMGTTNYENDYLWAGRLDCLSRTSCHLIPRILNSTSLHSFPGMSQTWAVRA
jgi:hypothetical protein